MSDSFEEISSARLPSVPGYSELVNRHGLTMLKNGADLNVVDGDIALTKDGDMMLGDASHSALHRLVDRWNYNYPHMEYMYKTSLDMLSDVANAESRLEQCLANELRELTESFGNPNQGTINRLNDYTNAWHNIRYERGSSVHGHHVYAGCVVLIISSMILRFKDDLDASHADWQASGQLFGNRSVGEVIVAGANGFRHEDEWIKTNPPNSQQKRSQDVISDALNPIPASRLDTPPGRCADILHVLSGGTSFERLTGIVLGFAHDVAQRSRASRSALTMVNL